MSKKVNKEKSQEVEFEQTNPSNKFDPSKQYRWNPDDEFTITGLELDILNKNLSAFTTGELSPANILKVIESFTIVQNKIISNIELGKINEIIPEELV